MTPTRPLPRSDLEQRAAAHAPTPADENVTAASEKKTAEGGGGGWGWGVGASRGGFHSAEEREGAERRGEEKKATISDEKTRCEEGKMLLLEAFFSNQ